MSSAKGTGHPGRHKASDMDHFMTCRGKAFISTGNNYSDKVVWILQDVKPAWFDLSNQHSVFHPEELIITYYFVQTLETVVHQDFQK